MTLLEAKRRILHASNEDHIDPLFANRLLQLQKDARDLRTSILRFKRF